MADNLPVSLYYRNLKGINLKSSEYTTDRAEFLNLRNVDFDVPNALQKRPGSTQAIATGTSTGVIGLFEYIRLNGASWVVAGSNTALFYIASNGLTLLDSGWTSGQPQDMLTFVNKLWVADGTNYKTWDGGVSYGVLPVGLPVQRTTLQVAGLPFTGSFGTSFYGLTTFLVGGATMVAKTGGGGAGTTFVSRGVYVAYSYLRSDGYVGPAEFLKNARNVVTKDPNAEGAEFFSQSTYNLFKGVTIPSGYGISSIQVWLAVDTVRQDSTLDYDIGPAGDTWNGSRVGEMGWGVSLLNGYHYMSLTLKPSANLRRFGWVATVPGASLFQTDDFMGGTAWAFTLPISFTNSDGENTPATAFSGMPFAWFDTNTPKYIDVNQNVMFMSGFSSTPSTIWFSEVGAPETILPEYNFEVRTNDGDRVVGHRTYNGNVIVFKTTSFHKVVGVDPATFELVELSLEFGAVSNNAIIEYNEKLLFLDRKGIIQYDGASWKCISDGIDDIFRRMNLNAAYEKAVAIHNHYRNQVWFGIPVDGSTENNLTIVYDYLVDSWTFFDGYNASSFAVVKSTLSKQTAWRGNYSGMIYYTGESFLGDNGQGISCVTFSRFEQFQGENSTNVWRRMFLDVSPVSGLTGVINGRVFTDYNQSTVKATFAMYQSQFQNKAEMGVVGKAVAFEASHYSASLPFLLNGYTWAKRHLRNV